jgi:hypothetical protein
MPHSAAPGSTSSVIFPPPSFPTLSTLPPSLPPAVSFSLSLVPALSSHRLFACLLRCAEHGHICVPNVCMCMCMFMCARAHTRNHTGTGSLYLAGDVLKHLNADSVLNL